MIVVIESNFETDKFEEILEFGAFGVHIIFYPARYSQYDAASLSKCYYFNHNISICK